MADKHKKDLYSFRFSARSEFALRLLARLHGRTKSREVEELIHDAAENLTKHLGTHWETLFDPEPGVAFVNMIKNPHIRFDDEEAMRQRFILAHKEFFFDEQARPDRVILSVLWPKIDDYVAIWQKKNTEAAREQMIDDLRKAKVKPPK